MLRKTSREESHHPAFCLSEREGGQREQRSVLQILADFHVWSASHSAFKTLNPVCKPPHTSPPPLFPSSLSLWGSSYSPSLSWVKAMRVPPALSSCLSHLLFSSHSGCRLHSHTRLFRRIHIRSSCRLHSQTLHHTRKCQTQKRLIRRTPDVAASPGAWLFFDLTSLHLCHHQFVFLSLTEEMGYNSDNGTKQLTVCWSDQ